MKKLMEVRTNCTITFCSEKEAQTSFSTIVKWSKKNTSSNVLIQTLHQVINTVKCNILATNKKILTEQVNSLLSLCKKCKGCCSFKSIIEVKPEIVYWTEHESQTQSKNTNLFKNLIKLI